MLGVLGPAEVDFLFRYASRYAYRIYDTEYGVLEY